MTTATQDDDHIEPISPEENEFAVLEPQQHCVLAHGFAQAMLMAGFDKKKKTFANSVEDAVGAAAHLGTHCLDPQTLNIYYETRARAEGRINPLRESIRIKAMRATEDKN